MKRTFYVLILTLALAVLSPIGTGLADVVCPTDTTVPPVDTPVPPIKTIIVTFEVTEWAATTVPAPTLPATKTESPPPTPFPTSTFQVPTYPPPPTEVTPQIPTATSQIPISDPTPTTPVETPQPYPMATETTVPYPAPDQPKHKVTPTLAVLPETGFFDENPFAPLIVLAVVCVSAFGFSRFVRKHGNS